MQSNPEPLRGDGRGSNLANRGKDEMSKSYMRGESFIQTGRLLNISILYQHHKFMLQKVSSFLFHNLTPSLNRNAPLEKHFTLNIQVIQPGPHAFTKVHECIRFTDARVHTNISCSDASTHEDANTHT